MVRDTGEGGSGPGWRTIKQKKKPKGGQTCGEAAARMRLMVPLFEGIQLRPHLRDLVANYAVHHCYRTKVPVTVVKGTKVRQVSEARLMQERKVLQEGDMHKPEEIER